MPSSFLSLLLSGGLNQTFPPDIGLDPYQLEDRRGQGTPNVLQQSLMNWGQVLNSVGRRANPQQRYPDIFPGGANSPLQYGLPPIGNDYGGYNDDLWYPRIPGR